MSDTEVLKQTVRTISVTFRRFRRSTAIRNYVMDVQRPIYHKSDRARLPGTLTFFAGECFSLLARDSNVEKLTTCVSSVF